MKPTAFGPVRWAMNVPPILRADGRPDDTAHHVLLVLATFAKKDGTDARPGLETLADKAYLTTTKAAADALDRLTTAGLISKAGEFGGTVVWTLHMHIVRSGSTAIDERRERAKEKARERQRRYAERQKEINTDGVAHRQLTPSETVSETSFLTVSDSVSTPPLTVCDTVTDAVPHHQLTVSPPSEPQVTTGVTALGTAIELPKEVTPSLRDGDSPEPTKKTKRATRIPDDFAPTDSMIAWARENTSLVGRRETEDFIDYWQAKSGKDATKVDWPATWRRWMRRAQGDAERRRPAPLNPQVPTGREAKARGWLELGLADPIADTNQPTFGASPELRALEGGRSA